MNTNLPKAMGSDSGEESLRLIAGLPAPDGLEERVHRALRAAPRGRVSGGGRILAWPGRFRAKNVLGSNWMRATAAAAIVFVVVGGGWGVYSRVQPGPAGKVIVMPQLVPGSGGIKGAGAIRVPATIPGPKIREQGNKGPRAQETQTAKKAVAPRKAATGQPSSSAPMPQPAVPQ